MRTEAVFANASSSRESEQAIDEVVAQDGVGLMRSVLIAVSVILLAWGCRANGYLPALGLDAWVGSNAVIDGSPSADVDFGGARCARQNQSATHQALSLDQARLGAMAAASKSCFQTALNQTHTNCEWVADPFGFGDEGIYRCEVRVDCGVCVQ